VPEFFELVELAPGVHAAVSDIAGAAVGNAAIIDTGDKTLVIDSFMTAQAAKELRAEATRLTGRAVFLLVNTHWHSDHTWGNQEFADVPIVGTERTVELMVADAPADLGDYEAELDEYLATLRARLKSDDPAEHATAQRRIPGVEQWKLAVPGFRLTVPSQIITDRLAVAGQRRVELLTYGGGHTDSDVFAWLPDDRILIAGDLCWNRIHPRTHDGHPGPWADILDRLVALGPQQVHPGHGRPGGAEVAGALVPYMRTVAGYVVATEGGADAAVLPPPPGSEDWESPERMRSGVATLAARSDPAGGGVIA
jgi:glyoxylase-like metal-dependent hydrolase (beta-lactamase superfamily II)